MVKAPDQKPAKKPVRILIQKDATVSMMSGLVSFRKNQVVSAETDEWRFKLALASNVQHIVIEWA